MTDIDVTPDEEVEDQTEEKEAEEKKSKKKPLPEGWVTPTQLTNHLNSEYDLDLKPQQMYGWVKSGKEFPGRGHEEYSEGEGKPALNPADGRYIVPLDEGEAWVLAQLKRQQERKAKKAQKEAEAEAEEEIEASDSAPEVEATSESVDLDIEFD